MTAILKVFDDMEVIPLNGAVTGMNYVGKDKTNKGGLHA